MRKKFAENQGCEEIARPDPYTQRGRSDFAVFLAFGKPTALGMRNAW